MFGRNYVFFKFLLIIQGFSKRIKCSRCNFGLLVGKGSISVFFIFIIAVIEKGY